MTTELLRLCSPGVCDQECPIVGNQFLLELECTRCIEVLRVVRNNCLRDRLTDGIHLRGMSTTLDAETDVNRGESLLASDEDRLIDLKPQDLRLKQGDGSAVEVDQATTLLCMCNCGCGLDRTGKDERSTWVGEWAGRDMYELQAYLLFAESLNGLRRGCHFIVCLVCRGLSQS